MLVFDRLSRSWTLVKASASVLRQDKELLVFPLISFIALTAVLIAFAIPTIGLGFVETFNRHGTVTALHYVIAFLFYFSQYFVIFFFNSALIGAAMMRFDGETPTVGDGIRIATSRIGVIAGYALIAATVGLILRIIQERVGFVGKIIVSILGASWSIATFLVVPILVTRDDLGPIDAVKESASLLRKTWGESLIGQVGMSAAFGFIFIGVFGCGFLLFALAFATKSIALIVIAAVITLLALGLTGLIQAALMGIYEAALYRYAVDGKETPGFDTDALQLAFSPK